jgi:hypothetical protein
MEQFNRPGAGNKISPAVFLTVGAVLTIGIIAGIKYMVSPDAESTAPATKASEPVFKEETDRPAGLRSQAAVPLSTATSLDMFQKANAGYDEEASSAAAVAAASPAAAVKKAKPARETVKAAPKRTVIPRMGAFKQFGGAAASGQGAQGGAAMPDISGMIKQAQQQQKNGGN